MRVYKEHGDALVSKAAQALVHMQAEQVRADGNVQGADEMEASYQKLVESLRSEAFKDFLNQFNDYMGG